MAPQLRKILVHLDRAGHITGREALIDHAITALPRRISDLKALGYKFDIQRCKHPITGQRYVRYSLKTDTK